MRAQLPWLCLLVLSLGALAGPAAARDEYYAGKTIRIVLGFTPGGGFDTYSRRTYALSPGTPVALARILRAAFPETLRDPEFLADAGRGKLDVDPIVGEQLEQVVNELFGLNATVVASCGSGSDS